MSAPEEPKLLQLNSCNPVMTSTGLPGPPGEYCLAVLYRLDGEDGRITLDEPLDWREFLQEFELRKNCIVEPDPSLTPEEHEAVWLSEYQPMGKAAK